MGIKWQYIVVTLMEAGMHSITAAVRSSLHWLFYHTFNNLELPQCSACYEQETRLQCFNHNEDWHVFQKLLFVSYHFSNILPSFGRAGQWTYKYFES